MKVGDVKAIDKTEQTFIDVALSILCIVHAVVMVFLRDATGFAA